MTYRSNPIGREPPTPTDDVNKGYGIGSRWTDKIHNRKYTCTDATNRAAIWIEDYADVTDPASVGDAGAVMDSDFLKEDGFMLKTGEGTYEAIKSNMEASAAPATSDDSDSGYAIGSRWLDTTSEEEYVCFDATAGAAVWIETTASYTHPQEPPCRAATAAQTGHATAAQITKLAGIATGATKYPDTGEQAFLDGDHTKLNGIEAAADVTDSTNVTAAGAVMQSIIKVGAPSEVTLSDAGVAAITSSHHTIDSYGDAATDTMTGISGGVADQILILRPESSARTITIDSGFLNIALDGGADFVMDHANDQIILLRLHDSDNWIEISRSNNGT